MYVIHLLVLEPRLYPTEDEIKENNLELPHLMQGKVTLTVDRSKDSGMYNIPILASSRVYTQLSTKSVVHCL